MDPLILPRNCGNCRHFDEDCHCALPRREALILGAIVDPAGVVCEKHDLDTEAAHNETAEGAPV